MAAPSRKVLSEVQMQLDLVTSQCGSVMQQLDLLKDRVIRNNAADEVKKDETGVVQQGEDAVKPVEPQPERRLESRDRLLSSSSSSSSDDDDTFSDVSLKEVATGEGNGGGGLGDKKKDIIQLMYERLRMMDETGFKSEPPAGSPDTDREVFHDLSSSLSSGSDEEEKVEGGNLEHILSAMSFIRGPGEGEQPGRKEKRSKKDDLSKKNALKKKLKVKKVKISSNSGTNSNKKENKIKNKVSPYEVPLSKIPLIIPRASETLIKPRSSLQISSDKKLAGFQKKLTPKTKAKPVLRAPEKPVFNEPLKRVKKMAETLKRSASQARGKKVEEKPPAVKFNVSEAPVVKESVKLVKSEDKPLARGRKPVVSTNREVASKSKPSESDGKPPPRAMIVKKNEPQLISEHSEVAPAVPIPVSRRASVKTAAKDPVEDVRSTRQTVSRPVASQRKPAPLIPGDAVAPSRETLVAGPDDADCRIRRTKSFVTRHDFVSPNVSLPSISFNAIPFIVGQSTSKSYHIGLNIQQTLSLLKITPSLTGMPVLNDRTSKDAISTATSLYSSKRTNSGLSEDSTCPACASLNDTRDNVDGDLPGNPADPWAVPLREPWEMPNRLPSKCTCLPKPVVSIQHVLSQLLQNDKMTASHHALNGIQNIQDEKYLDEEEKLKQSVRKYTGSNTLYFAKLLKTMQDFRERVIKSEM